VTRLALALLVLATAVPAAAGAARQSSQVQVVEKEYSLTLSRLRVRSGKVTVQLVNFGMDDHDLVVQGAAKGAKPVSFSMLAPGKLETKTLTLAPGRYTLYCSLPGHRALGMVATLVVAH
jgi:plastocyanin